MTISFSGDFSRMPSEIVDYYRQLAIENGCDDHCAYYLVPLGGFSHDPLEQRGALLHTLHRDYAHERRDCTYLGDLLTHTAVDAILAEAILDMALDVHHDVRVGG